MLLRTHLVFSIFVFLFLFPYLSMNKVLFFAFLVFGTLFVDIDSSKSKIGRKWFLRPVQWVVSHRGIFHTIIFGLILSILLYFINSVVGFGFFAGYLLHLFLDCFSKSGVRLFWPFSDLKIGLGKLGLKSGGLIEEIFFVLLLLGDLVLIYKIIF